MTTVERKGIVLAGGAGTVRQGQRQHAQHTRHPGHIDAAGHTALRTIAR